MSESQNTTEAGNITEGKKAGNVLVQVRPKRWTPAVWPSVLSEVVSKIFSRFSYHTDRPQRADGHTGFSGRDHQTRLIRIGSVSDRFQTSFSAHSQTSFSAHSHAGCSTVHVTVSCRKHSPCHHVMSDLRSHVGCIVPSSDFHRLGRTSGSRNRRKRRRRTLSHGHLRMDWQEARGSAVVASDSTGWSHGCQNNHKNSRRLLFG